MKEKYNVNVEKKIRILTFLEEQNRKEIIIRNNLCVIKNK
jgi:hypothetical protein